jgi:predicted nucleotidyltransferase
MTEVRARPELVPPELLDRVVRFFDPELVILFGSRARGDADADSDYDLLVVLGDDVPSTALGWKSAFRSAQGFSRRGRHRAVPAALVRGEARRDRLPCSHGRRGRHRGL